MCDYSLMHVNNRLAEEGETLETHRFGTGVIGLASAHDVQKLTAWQATRVKNGGGNTGERMPAVPAVCMPPGAQLTLNNVSEEDQKNLEISATERVTFDQLSARANSYRDAFCFSSGKAILLQKFRPGVKVVVNSLANVQERETVQENFYAMR